MEQRAVRRKRRDGFVGIGEQAAHAFGERQDGARRLGGGDQNRGYALVKHDARTDTGERAAKAGAEAAQPFEPLLRTGRQRRGQTDDLRRGRVASGEAALFAFGCGGGAEGRRADGVRP